MLSPGPTVLVVGGGGREHALGWALARSPRKPRLLFAPGNPGTAALGENVPVAADDLDGLVELARERAVALVVVGPEAALVAGLADELEEVGIPVFGPTAHAARIEGSKAWAKSFMARHGIPTAPSQSFTTDDRAAARLYVEGHALPVVLKADGLAAGKGVVVATTREEAGRALEHLLADDGAACVVEGFMKGEEASVFALCDGRDFVLLAPAQDHKRVGEGDTGPNTGGMGAYAPAPAVTLEVIGAVESQVIRPLLSGMASEGHPYKGVLYVGLMLGADGPRVVEFNARFGDPEAQVVLPLLASDSLALFEAVAAGSLVGAEAQTREGAAACVVLAAAGYPGTPRAGDTIHGLDGVPPDVLAFHAGTRRDDSGRLLTAGGRVLGITGQGSTLAEALARAYAGVAAVHFDGAQYRRDIGHRGLAHEAAEEGQG